MKPRIVPQPYENRRQLAKLVDQWHKLCDEYQGKHTDMEYRIRSTMRDWLQHRLDKASLYHSNRAQYRELYGKYQHNREEQQVKREYEQNAKTLG